MCVMLDPSAKRKAGATRLICATLVPLLIAGATAQARVEVNVTRVGFPTQQQGSVVRSGAWVPVIVDLALLDQPGFDGSLRVGQLDIDGDECYDEVDVHLRADTGGTQRYYLYALANLLHNQGRFLVELFTDEGEAVEVVSQGELTLEAQTARQPFVMGDDEILILSISTGMVGRVRDLVASDQHGHYARPLHVGHMSPTDLPELWIGLDTVDYIVWDDARPEELTERQVEALIEWVRQGGTLLIAASRSVGSLKLAHSIDAVLPVDLGDLTTVDNLPRVRTSLLTPRADIEKTRGLEGAWWEKPFDTPVQVIQCTLRDGATRIAGDSGSVSNVVTRRRVGRGHIIFSAVTLEDLFSASGSPVEFFREVFHLNLLGDSEKGTPDFKTLFPYVVSAVAFATSGSLYLLIAGMFSIVYVVSATFGSWAVLGARRWRHHSWSVFALVALAASLLSIIAVNSARGFGETLHQISVVDLDANEAYGYATAFFGLKTGTDRKLDLWLPSDPLGAVKPGTANCFLRPLPPASDPSASSSSFADPGEYRLVPASAVISDVRIRATLKRFEGRWEGVLGGTVTGEITVKGDIRDGSYIVNNLGVDLNDCYLLHTALDPAKGGAPRSGAIYTFPIGRVPSDGSRIELVPRCYPTKGIEDPTKAEAKPRLVDAQKAWGSEFRSALRSLGSGWGSNATVALGREKDALMLLSTVGEYDPTTDSWMATFIGTPSWSRDRARRLDLRDQLRRDSVILIGFADDPGPVRLFHRTGDRPYRVLKPEPKKSWTMYRIRIPVTLLKESKQQDAYEVDENRID